MARAKAVCAEGSPTATRRAGGARGGQVGEDAVQLAVGPRPQRRVHPVLELFRIEPSFGRGLAQPLGDRLAVGVGGSE